MNLTHRKTSSLFAMMLCYLTPAALLAHGGDPVPRDVHVLEDGSWLMVTSFGVIASDAPRHYVCEEAFLGSDDFFVLPRSTTTWTTISENRIAVTQDGGCNFEVRSGRLEGTPIAAATSPDRVVQAFVLGEKLHWSEDLWETRGEVVIEPMEQVQWTGMRFGSQDTVFVVGYSRQEETRGSARLVELDLSPLRRGEAEPGIVRHTNVSDATYPYLFDVGAGKLAGIANVGGSLSLLWNGPEQWLDGRAELGGWPVDVAASPDGQRIAAAGGRATGEAVVYWYDNAQGLLGEQVVQEDEPSACVAWSADGERLLHCGRASSQAVSLGSYPISREFADQGERIGEQDVLVAFDELEGPREAACDASQSEAVKTCKIVWPELARALRIDLEEPGGEMGTPMETLDMEADMNPSPGVQDMSSTGDDMGRQEPTKTPSSKNDDTSSCATLPSSQENDNLPIPLIFIGFFAIFWRHRRAKLRG